MLDELVPPVKQRRHWIAIGSVLTVAVATVWAASTGWLVPLTEGPSVLQWGGEGPVYAVVHVTNDSPRDLEITGLRGVPGGLSVVGYGTTPARQWEGLTPPVEADVFPITLGSGDSVDISVTYIVDDCSEVAEAGDPPSVRMRLPGLTGLWEFTRESSWDGNQSWPFALTEFACTGAANQG